jgi:hypothetical protein
MKTSKDQLTVNNPEMREFPKKTRTGKLRKLVMVFLLFAWIPMLSSCMVAFRTPGFGGGYAWNNDYNYRHSYGYHHHGHGNHHSQWQDNGYGPRNY